MRENKKVDVAINIFGKPFQTLACLRTIWHHCSQHIDRFLIVLEKEQPKWQASAADSIQYLVSQEPFAKKVFFYTPKKYEFAPIGSTFSHKERLCYRYQWAIEGGLGTNGVTDCYGRAIDSGGVDVSRAGFISGRIDEFSDLLFICHNDMLFTGDIIGAMLDSITDGVSGVGYIGQCWNCPFADNCNHDYLGYQPTKEELTMDHIKLAASRPGLFMDNLQVGQIMPCPECRLNEFAAIISREDALQSDVYFGEYTVMDLGVAWFRDMVNRGYRFTHFDIYQYGIHGYFANDTCGYTTQKDAKRYFDAEINAEHWCRISVKEQENAAIERAEANEKAEAEAEDAGVVGQ